MLFVLLAILACIVLLLLLNVKIVAGYSDKFYYRITVGAFPVKPEWFTQEKKKEKKHKAAGKKKKNKKSTSGEKAEEKKKGKSPAMGASLILELAKKAAEVLPRVFRIRLRRFYVNVGGEDAAEIALDYGKIYALTEGALAVVSSYSGIFYGFRADRRKIRINADFLSPETTINAELAISFFVWQLLFAAVRIGVVYVLNMLEAEK